MKEYPIIGMSPGNSYFKDDEIKYLLKTTVEKYGRVAVIIPDVPAISTYLAMGYPENLARNKKSISQGNFLKNRTRRVIDQLGYTKDQVRIIDWGTEVEPNEEYKKLYKAVRDLYESNKAFQRDADETTKGVILGSKKEIKDLTSAIKTAVHYLLSEIAFNEFAPGLLNTKKIVYIYHKNWPVYENYIAGKYDGKSKDYMDFFLMENPWETYRSVWEGEDYEDGEYKNVLDRVEQTKILRVAFTNYPPALMYDHDYDNFSGIFYEIIVSIAKKHGWQIRWSEETGYGVIIDGLDHNRFDLFGSAVWPTPERKEKASFSTSLYRSEAYPWMLAGFDYDKLKDTKELRVVVRENDITHSIATADFPNARLVFVPQLSDPQEVLQFVSDGKGDITFVEPYLAKTFMKATGLNLVPAIKEPIRTYENVFIFKKEDTSLRDLFNAEIKEMVEDGRVKDLIQKYTGDSFGHEIR